MAAVRILAVCPRVARPVAGVYPPAMAIREQIDAKFKQARLDRDDRTKTVIGMLKSKVLNELKSGKGTEETDELWTGILTTYVKQLKKSVAEYEKAGERGKEALEELSFELGFCEQFLPKKLDEAATEALVRKLAGELGVTDLKQQGKLMGALMKNHKGEIDGDLARQIVQKVLG